MELSSSFNNLDYVVLGLVLLSGLFALMRGLVREVFSLIAWIASYVLAAKYYPLAEPWAHRYIKQDATASEAAAVIVFCLAFIVLSITGAVIAHFIKGKTLTAIDRSLGFVFGLLRGALVVCLIYLMANTILWPEIDAPKALPKPALEAMGTTPPAEAGATPESEDAKKSPTPPAPAWLLQAKTRPFMAYGAAQLKTFIPEKLLEQKGKHYLEQGSTAAHIIQRNSEDVLTNPNHLSSPSPDQGTRP